MHLYQPYPSVRPRVLRQEGQDRARRTRRE